LGWVYYQRGQYQKAVEQLERAVDLSGDDPTITEHLGDAYQKLGKYREASHEYQDALTRTKEADQVGRLKDKMQALRDDGRASQ
jgi:tetratricopeptide (TPR) repeat protein